MALVNFSDDEYQGIKYLQPLFRLAYFLGLSPIYDLRSNNYSVNSFYKFYAVFVLSLIFVVSIADFFPGNELSGMSVSFLIVNTVTSLLQKTTNMWYICSASLRCSKDFVKIFSLFGPVEKILKAGATDRRKVLRFYLEFNLAHVFLGMYYAYDLYFWVFSPGISNWRVLVLWNLLDYFVFVMTLLYRSYVVEIKFGFRNLNKRLVDYVSGISRWQGDPLGQDVKALSKAYTILCEQISLGNEVFGYPILFMSLYLVFEFLLSLLLLMVYTLDKIDLKYTDYSVANMCAHCLIWGLKNMIIILFAISPCHEATSEAKQTSIICYKLLQELPNVNSIFQDKSMRDDLILLAIQSSTRHPVFSAAGFFTVDYTMLFTLLGSITSYLVVLIQFK